jgi:hypothetical protein
LRRGQSLIATLRVEGLGWIVVIFRCFGVP